MSDVSDAISVAFFVTLDKQIVDLLQISMQIRLDRPLDSAAFSRVTLQHHRSGAPVEDDRENDDDEKK